MLKQYIGMAQGYDAQPCFAKNAKRVAKIVAANIGSDKVKSKGKTYAKIHHFEAANGTKIEVVRGKHQS